MKSTFLKTIKVVALSLVLSLGASSVVLANGGGNGAGGSATRKTRGKRVAKRVVKNRRRHTA